MLKRSRDHYQIKIISKSGDSHIIDCPQTTILNIRKIIKTMISEVDLVELYQILPDQTPNLLAIRQPFYSHMRFIGQTLGRPPLGTNKKDQYMVRVFLPKEIFDKLPKDDKPSFLRKIIINIFEN